VEASRRDSESKYQRIYDRKNVKIISASITKSGQRGWEGVKPGSSDLLTCELEIPRGQLSIRQGRHFEVIYHIQASVGTKWQPRLVVVELPINIVHMNSLDIPPNSLVQVSTAMNERRARTSTEQSQVIPVCIQSVAGRAFASPRQQSLMQLQEQEANTFYGIRDLTEALDISPRRLTPRYSKEIHLKRPITPESAKETYHETGDIWPLSDATLNKHYGPTFNPFPLTFSTRSPTRSPTERLKHALGLPMESTCISQEPTHNHWRNAVVKAHSDVEVAKRFTSLRNRKRPKDTSLGRSNTTTEDTRRSTTGPPNI
jgi:hypothetical protein